MAIKEWYADKKVSTNWTGRVHVAFDDDTSKATQTITMRLKFKTAKTQTRYRHKWVVKFYIDDVLKKTINNQLPDNNTKSGVESAGSFSMTKGTWWNWGAPCQITLPNNGKAHTFKITFTCETTPTSSTLSMSRTMPTHKIVPATPSPKAAKFNETTRKISYAWNIVRPCAFILIHRTMYDEAGTVVTQGWIKDTDGKTNRKFYNKDIGTVRVQEVIPENVTRVVWYMRNYSASNHWEPGRTLTTNIDTYSKVWIKVGTQWKKATPWVKVGNEWKKVSKTYVKVGSSWKRTNS